jgi:hypothetical protein
MMALAVAGVVTALVPLAVPSVSLAEDVVDVTTTTVETTTEPEQLPRVLLVGDSTMAPMRWFRDGTRLLSGATFVVDVESCRALGGRSCYGREKRIPTTALNAVKSAKGPFDVVVLMAGTHNLGKYVKSELSKIQQITDRMGAKLVIFTLRDFTWATKSRANGPWAPKALNEIIRRAANSDATSLVSMADWSAFSKGRKNWFRRDGIHPNIRGTVALQWYISRVVAHTLGRKCEGDEREVCPMPVPADALYDWMQYFGVKYTDTHCYEDGVKRVKKCERDRRMP